MALNILTNGIFCVLTLMTLGQLNTMTPGIAFILIMEAGASVSYGHFIFIFLI
jgi:hypothetical protein